MHVEHIIPAEGNEMENLCLSCPNCNFSKAKATEGLDPITGQSLPLFNPRKLNWQGHFKWNADFTQIIGLTPTGRATIDRLKMNQLKARNARERWILAGHHPPAD